MKVQWKRVRLYGWEAQTGRIAEIGLHRYLVYKLPTGYWRASDDFGVIGDFHSWQLARAKCIEHAESK